MSVPSASNVSVGAPKASGGIYSAPLGTTLPTDATTALNAAFVNGGYVSDDGLKNTIKLDFNDVPEWGGSTVLSVRKSRTESFSFGLIETTGDTLAVIYGSDNVVVGDGGIITATHSNTDLPYKAWVFEIALTGGRVKRIVVPSAKMTDLDDIEYKSDDAITYTPTLTCSPDSAGNTAYEYITAAAA